MIVDTINSFIDLTMPLFIRAFISSQSKENIKNPLHIKKKGTAILATSDNKLSVIPKGIPTCNCATNIAAIILMPSSELYLTIFSIHFLFFPTTHGKYRLTNMLIKEHIKIVAINCMLL